MYGSPAHKEANPMVTTSIMFPFLFGVMFGDIFHGTLLFFAGLFLVFAGLPGKWTVLLYGFFSFYCGLIYNDFNALPTYMFNGGKSCWNTDIENLPIVTNGKFKTRFSSK
jgi:V-type H+-transporting ATPase subunit a